MKVIIICRRDKISNEKRALEIKKFLKRRSYKVELLDVLKIDFLKNSSSLQKIFYYVRLWLHKKGLSYYPMLEEIRLKGKYWNKVLNHKDFDILICQSCSDDLFFLEDDFKKKKCLRILDVPTPWVAELKFSKEYPLRYINKIQRIEKEIYKKCDYVLFSWKRYIPFVKKNVTTEGNFLALNWGCDKTSKKAKYSPQPKIVVLGSLGWYWNNTALLSKLQKISPYQIDVYGASPGPPKIYNINYLGYAPSLDILSSYQFGLLTVSKDELRRNSFSSRQMTYISYGLPVLLPEWYTEPILDEVSISYNEKNFTSQLLKYSKKKNWEIKHKNSLTFAKKFSWEKTLKPLDRIIRNYKVEKTYGI